MKKRILSRQLALLLVLGLLLSQGLWGCATTGPMGASGASSGKARNIILLIGDGMGPSQFGAALLYSNRILGKDLKMAELMNAGRTAYLLNDTADAIVTESAAAAGQIATGQKMTARAISMAADGKTSVKTIMELAKDKGLATGLVTTSGITDATPAAFAAHVSNRSDEVSVADQETQTRRGCAHGWAEAVLPARGIGRCPEGRPQPSG